MPRAFSRSRATGREQLEKVVLGLVERLRLALLLALFLCAGLGQRATIVQSSGAPCNASCRIGGRELFPSAYLPLAPLGVQGHTFSVTASHFLLSLLNIYDAGDATSPRARRSAARHRDARRAKGGVRVRGRREACRGAPFPPSTLSEQLADASPVPAQLECFHSGASLEMALSAPVHAHPGPSLAQTSTLRRPCRPSSRCPSRIVPSSLKRIRPSRSTTSLSGAEGQAIRRALRFEVAPRWLVCVGGPQPRMLVRRRVSNEEK